MKLFLSWSGERSRLVADLFDQWIRCVLQAADPWISTRDIDRGAVWFTQIGDQLKDVSTGIVFLTRENKERPWILFEAGALYKGLDTRVCTLLVDLQPADVQAPLGQFNHTLPVRESLKLLVETLNGRLAKPLDLGVLDSVFDIYWPRFEAKFNDALAQTSAAAVQPAEARSEQDLLGEILENTRSLTKRIGAIEQRNVAARDRRMSDPFYTPKGQMLRDTMAWPSNPGQDPETIFKRGGFMDFAMSNVFIEPKPSGSGPINHYVIEHTDGTSIDGQMYSTQDEAMQAAKAAGFARPLLARVRATNKGNPDHWRSA